MKPTFLKLTLETKIGEFLSKDAYDESCYIDDIYTPNASFENNDIVQIIFNIKKKYKKDFEWYKNKYDEKTISEERVYIKNHPAEYNIGLFRFICDKVGIASWIGALHGISITHTFMDNSMDIFPKEFLESLIK